MIPIFQTPENMICFFIGIALTIIVIVIKSKVMQK